MKKHLLFFGLVLSSIVAQAQEPTSKYFNKVGEEQPTAEGAYYRKEVESKGGTAAIVRTFYISGKPRSVAFYEDFVRNTEHGISEGWHENGNLSWRSAYEHGKSVGTHESFFPDGKLKYRQQYSAGKREGELLLYYADGQLKRREMYVANERTTGICYSAQGQEIPFFEYEKMPVFPGDQQALLQYIGQNVRYPGKALRRGVQGKVLIKFIVDTTGVVSHVRVAKGLDPLLDAEALHVVENLPRFEPGRQDGCPVPVYFTVPITFAINNEPLFKPRSATKRLSPPIPY
ncbi:TonB family protein [Hymenobacter taeanensis]|uniref:TonB family protein n=1 Tax=Hymenobacter taeanensis TaxID=2735321 RepID=A0A6M6BKQ9_9BACT|nr:MULTISPECIES: energy transducer TonB [Hymenobacter]QJX48696.1 TonB family protein [Hymenobacter taeanensis]UOQ81804.1 TonB family protein [Hymenobacter sp. 5414T-23]